MNYLEELDSKIKNENYFSVCDHKIYINKDPIQSNTYSVNSYTPDMNAIYKVYFYLIKNGYEVSRVYLDLASFDNTSSITNIEYKYLKYIDNYIKKNNLSTDVDIRYEDDLCYFSNVDDLIAMIESLKWYRSIIEYGNLSPYEKLIYAYDIAKTYKYTSSGDTDVDNEKDNSLHLIIKTGNIVCFGYNDLIMHILNGLDKNVVYDEFTTICYEDGPEPEYHSRGIVKIDDYKYNIHGIYMCDPTWDSIHDNRKYIYGDKYDALSGYRYFMVPITKYRRFFRGDTYPRLFYGGLFGYEKRLTKKRLDEMINDPFITDKNIYGMDGINFAECKKILHSDMTYKTLLKYLNCERPDSETFCKAICIVRMNEGYDYEDINNTLIYGIDTDIKDAGTIIVIDEENENAIEIDCDYSNEKQLVL